ncbi:ZIP family metal transporter [Arthrobacter sp. MDT2-16]|uniref:ZIP family metal transporter n=1 Tax=Arthrobacter ruber TaxID=1258893 RepID=UPI000CF50A44|nr:ZIP family zinc transporter [Arthrobacter ruber]
MPLEVQAFAWGAIAGAALLIGAAIAWKWKVPPRTVSFVMAFGAGVLISALAFELVAEAQEAGGLVPTGLGFLVGAVAYVGANAVLARKGAQHRKRSGGQQPRETEDAGSGNAIALGALLDGIPESVVLGLGLVASGTVNPAVLVAIFISNVPEGLSSSAGMRNAGRGPRYVFGLWGGIALVSGLSALAGYSLLAGASGVTIAFITAIAAGAILAMVADTMIPEAFEKQHMLTGLIAALGFLTAFVVHEVSG